MRGPNGHFYRVVAAPQIAWADANAAASVALRCGQPAHLATITSFDEDAFIESIRLAAPFLTGLTTECWVGVSDPGSATPADGWQWVNGEGPISGANRGPTYANWLQTFSFEPSGDGAFLGVGLYNFWGPSPTSLFGWNDEGNLRLIGGYVLEWDVDATVMIDGCDTGVANVVLDEDTLCTISDLIAECAAGATNHGDFVSCVAHLTNALKKAGLISGADKGAIQSCAAQAAIP
ncbi:MAG: hypothetical protein H7A46_21600 [Verrucomicrobiales bacterium]|nr:hypothetical protein [Verrucomicrobiales bacterium]